jgi:hypothetical protein
LAATKAVVDGIGAAYMSLMQARCSCGAVVLDVDKPPAVRLFCHCTICQSVYGAPFSDITAQWPGDVRVNEASVPVSYIRRRYFPVSVKRGVCPECNDPIIGQMKPSPLPLTFVPSARYVDQDIVPAAVGHIFYDSRVDDIDDDLPKVEGFIRSELAAARWIVPRLLRR